MFDIASLSQAVGNFLSSYHPSGGGGGGGWSGPGVSGGGQLSSGPGYRPSSSASTPGVHPHIAKVVAQAQQRDNFRPWGTPEPGPARLEDTDPYAAELINQGKANPKQYSDWVKYVNQLGVDNPQGAKIENDIISNLAPHYSMQEFASHTPVSQMDISGKNPVDVLTQELLKAKSMPSTPSKGGEKSVDSGFKLTDIPMGIAEAAGGDPLSTGFAAVKDPLKTGGDIASAIGGLFDGGGGPDKGAAKKSVQKAVKDMMDKYPGIDQQTAYHALEYDITKNKGDLKPDDAAATFYKWQQPGQLSPQEWSNRVMPSIMNLEQQKIQNAIDYANMTSKQRTAAGLTSSVLSGIGFPSYLPHTPGVVEAWANYYMQNMMPNSINDFVKLIRPDVTGTSQLYKTAKGAGIGPAALPGVLGSMGGNSLGAFLQLFAQTPDSTDPLTGTPYGGSGSTSIDPNVQSTLGQ